MDGKDKRLLVFALAKSGCMAYTGQMLTAFQGVELVVFASAYTQEPLPEQTRFVKTYRNVIELIFNTFWILPQLLWQLKKHSRQAYRHAWFPVFHPWNLFLLPACKLLKIRSCLTVHDGVLHTGENHPLLQWWENACIQMADELVFLSRYAQEQTLQKIGYTAPAHVIPHGILNSGKQVSQRSLPAQPRLLFLGRIVRYKGLELLLEAVQKLNASSFSHLTVAGMAVHSDVPGPVSDKIRYLTHWLTEEEIHQLLREHDILVLPYTEASQSGVLTLGISAAIPMLCTKVGGLPEQLAEDEAVWTEPTTESIQKDLSLLLSDADWYKQLHQKLLLKRTQTGWENAVETLIKIIFSGPKCAPHTSLPRSLPPRFLPPHRPEDRLSADATKNRSAD
ncbi:MAG: glycosyltransferase [Saprospiraceae bacterium]|nr:glycosyltransferase [Saprospiraceae bacterium]